MEQLYERGLEVRRAVLGNDAVDHSLAAVNSFTQPMSELTTEWCWGEVWNRPGLDRRTRSIINLAMLTALNRPNELKLHVRGAINNGLTPDEIQEVFLQTAVYCGVPAAIESFSIASEILKEMKAI
jgi:4-carboxymuconolactone decarboxylase